MTAIDPSVVDEDDPLAVDPELDMYNPANGFREPPEPSKYAPEFLDRYRAAQRERVARLDARARTLVAEQRRHLRKMEAPGFSDLQLEERNHITRRAVVGQYMVVHRTEADPAYLDVSLHSWRSTRKSASILGPRPDRTNYAQPLLPGRNLGGVRGQSGRGQDHPVRRGRSFRHAAPEAG
ncbi:hypothetical protein ACWD5V_28900 [Streptomyces sp. NPDC002523]